MKLGIIISTADPETVFNALRLGNFAINEGEQVKVFLLGKGVKLDKIENGQFNIREQTEALLTAGGKIMTCGTCLKLHNSEGSDQCLLSTMKDLYQLIKDMDRVVTF